MTRMTCLLNTQAKHPNRSRKVRAMTLLARPAAGRRLRERSGAEPKLAETAGAGETGPCPAIPPIVSRRARCAGCDRPSRWRVLASRIGMRRDACHVPACPVADVVACLQGDHRDDRRLSRKRTRCAAGSSKTAGATLAPSSSSAPPATSRSASSCPRSTTSRAAARCPAASPWSASRGARRATRRSAPR